MKVAKNSDGRFVVVDDEGKVISAVSFESEAEARTAMMSMLKGTIMRAGLSPAKP